MYVYKFDEVRLGFVALLGLRVMLRLGLEQSLGLYVTKLSQLDLSS